MRQRPPPACPNSPLLLSSFCSFLSVKNLQLGLPVFFLRSVVPCLPSSFRVGDEEEGYRGRQEGRESKTAGGYPAWKANPPGRLTRLEA